MSIASQTIAWARGRMGQTVGAGECWDLVNSALIAAGANGSEYYGTIGDDIDYIWGDEIPLHSVQAGDILQTRDHVVTTTTVIHTVFKDGEEALWEEAPEEGRPHHSAIVTSLLDKNGTFNTVEQNVEPKGKKVQVKRFNSRDIPTVTKKKPGMAIDPRGDPKKKVPVTIITEVTVTVTGTIWAYRPKKR